MFTIYATTPRSRNILHAAALNPNRFDSKLLDIDQGGFIDREQYAQLLLSLDNHNQTVLHLSVKQALGENSKHFLTKAGAILTPKQIADWIKQQSSDGESMLHLISQNKQFGLTKHKVLQWMKTKLTSIDIISALNLIDQKGKTAMQYARSCNNTYFLEQFTPFMSKESKPAASQALQLDHQPASQRLEEHCEEEPSEDNPCKRSKSFK